MKTGSYVVLAIALLSLASCTTTQNQNAWRVEKTEIPLYYSSDVDPRSGNVAVVEYCGAKLSNGSDVLHVVYRPNDYPNRNPGFVKGDTVTIKGLDKAKDSGSFEGRDCRISDIEIAKLANKPDAGDGI